MKFYTEKYEITISTTSTEIQFNRKKLNNRKGRKYLAHLFKF